MLLTNPHNGAAAVTTRVVLDITINLVHLNVSSTILHIFQYNVMMVMICREVLSRVVAVPAVQGAKI